MNARVLRGPLGERDTWLSWSSMRARCRPGYNRAKYYIERGITVCERWHSFSDFLSDMGRRPSRGHTIDRIDNYRGYEPGNCRWATHKEQQRNRRNNHRMLFRGELRTLAEIADFSEVVCRKTVKTRLLKGMDPELAVTLPAGALAHLGNGGALRGRKRINGKYPKNNSNFNFEFNLL